MIKLILKEFKLFVIKPAFLFLLLSAILLAPNYPPIVVTFFVFFIIQICFTTGQTNRDIEFTATLPVSRKQIVLSKILTIVIIEILYLLVCIPFACISSLIIAPNGNAFGMNKNIAFFGYSLLSLSVFNLTFFPLYFKNCQKIGIPLVMGIISYAFFSVIFETIFSIVPILNSTFCSLNPEAVPAQIIFLVFCAIVFSILTFITHKISTKNFEKSVI